VHAAAVADLDRDSLAADGACRHRVDRLGHGAHLRPFGCARHLLRFAHMIRGFFTAVVLVALAYVLGFVLFVSLLPMTPAEVPKADGIVVLTGGGTRLDRAEALFERGVGKRLLISGVDQATTKETLKHLIHGGPRFDCCADLGYGAEDTRGNAQETADWARGHGFHALVVVTARYHMPRALHEFHAV